MKLLESTDWSEGKKDARTTHSTMYDVDISRFVVHNSVFVPCRRDNDTYLTTRRYYNYCH